MHNQAMQPTLVPRAADGWRYVHVMRFNSKRNSTKYSNYPTSPTILDRVNFLSR